MWLVSFIGNLHSLSGIDPLWLWPVISDTEIQNPQHPCPGIRVPKRLPTEQSTELTFHHELSSSIPHPFSRVIRVSHHIKASIFNFRFRGEVGVLFHCSDTVLNYLSILKIITKEIIPFLSIEWNSIKLGGPMKWWPKLYTKLYHGVVEVMGSRVWGVVAVVVGSRG